MERLSGDARLRPLEADRTAPGSAEACDLIREALEAGRFLARGQRVGGNCGLEFIPHSFWYQGGFLVEAENGVEAEAPDHDHGDRWTSILIEDDTCMAEWPAPEDILSINPIAIGAALERACPTSQQYDKWFLSHPSVLVTGHSDQSGERAIIDGGVFLTGAMIDPPTNAVSASGGHLSWSAVTVKLVDRVADAQPDPRGVGNADVGRHDVIGHAGSLVDAVQTHSNNVGTTLTDDEIGARVRLFFEHLDGLGRRFRHGDFEALLRRLAGGNKLRPGAADRLWRSLAPATWQKGGKPRAGTMADNWIELLSASNPPSILS